MFGLDVDDGPVVAGSAHHQLGVIGDSSERHQARLLADQTSDTISAGHQHEQIVNKIHGTTGVATPHPVLTLWDLQSTRHRELLRLGTLPVPPRVLHPISYEGMQCLQGLKF